MIDLPSVRASGAFNIARARVLWKDGKMRIYGEIGMIAGLINVTEPIRVPGWRNVWVAKTSEGEIKLSAKCSTCGGWSKVTRIPAEELWAS